MRRWRAILLCLLAGAVVNVLVAWRCARWPNARPADFSIVYDWKAAERGWPCPVPDGWPAPMEAVRWRGRGFARDSSSVSYDTTGVTYIAAHSRYGWPWRSLRTWRRDGPGGDATPQAGGMRLLEWHAGLCLFRADPSIGVYPAWSLPLVPEWCGFGLNTAVYAVPLWMLAFGTGRLSRARRRRRGLCPRCAYDLHGVTGPCPECGTPREAAP